MQMEYVHQMQKAHLTLNMLLTNELNHIVWWQILLFAIKINRKAKDTENDKGKIFLILLERH